MTARDPVRTLAYLNVSVSPCETFTLMTILFSLVSILNPLYEGNVKFRGYFSTFLVSPNCFLDQESKVSSILC